MEHVASEDPDAKDRLMRCLDGFMDRDREMFDLPPLSEKCSDSS